MYMTFGNITRYKIFLAVQFIHIVIASQEYEECWKEKVDMLQKK